MQVIIQGGVASSSKRFACSSSRKQVLKVTWVCRAKGFGSKPNVAKPTEEGKNQKPKQRMQRIDTPIEPTRDALPINVTIPAAVAARVEKDGDDDPEFAQRLKLLKEEGRLKAQEKKAAPQTEVDDSLYSNVPTLKETFLEQMNKDISDPAMRNVEFGPGRFALAAGAVAIVGVFIATSFYTGESKRYKGVQPSKPPPDEISQTILRTQLAQYESALKLNPTDPQALVGLGLAHSDLYEFDEASDVFERLVALPSAEDDADAWKLLGESSLLAKKSGRAVRGFEKAWALRGSDLGVLTELTDAYIADTQYQKAVDFLVKVRGEVAAKAPAAAQPPPGEGSSSGSAGGTATIAQLVAAAAPSGTDDSTSTSSAAPTEQDAVPAPALQDDGSSAVQATTSTDAVQAGTAATPAGGDAGGKEPQRRRSKLRRLVAKKPQALDAVSVDLLLAKSYSAWRGHDSDALAVYDNLTTSSPEDYRGYLAKGVWLRERGRKADAERAFMKARFLAPVSKQQLVQRVESSVSLDTRGPEMMAD